MNVIFLDFDGVLNSNKYFTSTKQESPFFLEDEKMHLLKQIIDQTNAKVVLSTSWREIWDTDLEIAKKLKDYFIQFDIDVYSITPCIEYNRVLEIKDWLNNHQVSSYVILDDILGPWFDLEEHVVVTNIDGHGLTEDDVKKAIEILKK